MRDAKRSLRRPTAALLLGGAMLLGAGAANAAPQCLRSTEIDADQPIRSGTRLILLSDTCSGHSYLFLFHPLPPASEHRAPPREGASALPARHAAPLREPPAGD